MLDAAIRRFIDPPLDLAGRGLARLGIEANAVTGAGFFFGVASWLALAAGSYRAALVLIVLNRLADGLDGAVARHRGVSDLGGYLDILADFIFYAGVPFAFAIGRPASALAASFLVFAFVGTGSSFLAFAVFAAKRGLATGRRGRKSLYYLGGLTEGTETAALFIAICLAPDWFDPLAWGFGALCWLTTATRVASAALMLRPPPQMPPQT